MDAHAQRQAYEDKLTAQNVQKAIRFLTQLVSGSQLGAAITYLTTRELKGKPFSNSILLHELREAEEWEKLGYDFAPEALVRMDDNERMVVRHARNAAFGNNPVPHFQGMQEQYGYLACVARTMGFDVTAGTLFFMSIWNTCNDIELMVKYDPVWGRLEEGEVTAARDFMLALASEESAYAIFSLEATSRTYNPAPSTPLYTRFRTDVERTVAPQRRRDETD